ncbi:MAG TPA: ATP-binding protein, partial [Vicinamibacterales bacterium]|nr:ATP-binding protein [Vicinamibacterales bacterium]
NDAGTRRQAFYSDLSPGRYRFHVTASNDDGVWNEAGAALDFVVAAAFYQTRWFFALSVGVALVVVWAAHRIRVRVVESHGREIGALNQRLMNAQEQERMRIAGELHDGVMQQMLSVTMMVGTAKRRIDDPLKAKATLDQVQEKLIQVGTDIRQLSHGLHPPMLQEAGLPEAVRAYCQEFTVASGISVECDCDDSARDLSRGAALALFRILQEALGNAVKHGIAKEVTVSLRRTSAEVSLVVSDDGVGFDVTGLSAGGLGLVMMRERAAQLDGTFHFASAPGRGTTIRVVIPFR